MIKSVKQSDSIKFPFSFCLWTRNFCWFICRRNQFGLHSLGRMLLWRRQLPVGNLFATTYLLWKCCLRIYYLVHCTYFQLRFMARNSVLSPGFFFNFWAMDTIWYLWLVFQVISALICRCGICMKDLNRSLIRISLDRQCSL